MPIVSSQIVRSHDRGNGSLVVHEEHTDHNGKIHEHRYKCPLDFDVDAALVSHVPIQDLELIEHEKDLLREYVEEGNNPSGYTVSHLSTNEVIKATAKAVMASRAGDVIEGSKYLQGVANSVLDLIFNISTRNRINTRVNNIVANEANIRADESQREEL